MTPRGANGSGDWTIASVRTALAAKKISARDLTREFYARIEKRNPELNAYLALCPERAYAQADRVDAMISAGAALPSLAGVPIAVKDVLTMRGVPTTCGSRILEGYRPPYDATCVERLEAAGAILLGKTNCDEFAMGSSNENSAYGPVRNPVALDRVPGGSSGGSAAAVAAGMAVVALGTDTGGSVRQPGSLCGIPAMMPSYGRISRYGLIAFASSLDRVSPFARNVHDIAAVIDVMAGQDARDSTSAAAAAPQCRAAIAKPFRGLRIGVPAECFPAGLNPDVRKNVEAGIAQLEKLGCTRVPVRLPHSDHAIAAYYVIATAEASSNLARYDGVRYGLRVPGATLMEMYEKTRGRGFGNEVKRRIVLGTYVLSSGYYDAYYLKAQKVRTLIARDFANAFAEVDLIITPTSPVPAFRLGERADDPLSMYLADIYTVTGSLAGITGISVPCGSTADGLPIGMQIYAPAFSEELLLQSAFAFEQAGAAARLN
jgi:aspartyl-tRNA(Asn)/glutamyl-tRNA(Gln) amidotransferase subunit A